MNYSILHLSDIHFRSIDDHIINKVSKISDAIRLNLLQSNMLFVIISGDIAFSGKNEEYEVAKLFLEELIKLIKDKNKEIKIEIIVAPGNHDCDFSVNKNMRENYLDNLRERGIVSSDDLKECLTVQSSFFNNMLEKYKPSNLSQSHLYYIYEFEQCNFIVYNTAWCSKLHESQGMLFFPDDVLQSLKLLPINKATIQVFHHPTHWLQQDSKRKFDKHLSSIPSIVFVGHEHTQESYIKSDILQEKSNVYILADQLQDSSNETVSGFSLITLQDGAILKYEIKIYDWNASDQIYITKKTDNFTLDDTVSDTTVLFDHSYESTINDIGFLCTHPRKAEISLNDIFISPDLEELYNNTNEKIDSIRINTSQIVSKLKDTPKLLIFGEEISGKTTILKQLQLELSKQNIIGVYIDVVKDIQSKHLDIQNLITEIKKIYSTQFKGNNHLDKFAQCDKKNLVLLIDNMNQIKFHYNEIEEFTNKMTTFLQNLEKISDQIIIMSDIEFLLQVTSTDLKKTFSSYKGFRLLEFGYYLIDKMINKWQRINTTVTYLDNEKLEEEKQEIRTVITKASQNNFLPRYPVYIINLIQAREMGKENINNNGFAYLYETLISRAFQIAKVTSNKRALLDLYLSEFAFYCFENLRFEISKNNINALSLRFAQERSISPVESSDLQLLVIGRLLNEKQEFYSFSQHYIYYYYLARYIIENIDDPHHKEKLTSLIDVIINRIYMPEFANITVFLIHHTKNKNLLLTKIVNQARNLFSDMTETNLLDSEFSSLADSITHKIDLDQKSTPENKSKMLMRQDQIERNSVSRAPNHLETRHKDEEIVELDIFAKINLSLKLIELLGLIAKNNPYLKNTMKNDLIEELFKLGFRAINVLLKFLNDNHSSISSDIENLISKKKLSKEEKNKETIKIVGNLTLLFSASFIHKIAASISSKELFLAFDNICNKYNSPAYKVLHQAIKLEFPSGLDIPEIKTTNESLKNQKIGQTLLRVFVKRYLYTFNIEPSKKDKLLSVFKQIEDKSILVKQNRLIYPG